MDALVLLWIIAAAGAAFASIIACAWLLVRALRGAGHPADGLGFASFAGFGILAFVALAFGLERAGTRWAFIALVAVNLLMQPLCLYLLAAGLYKLGMAMAGRVTYAWRIVPAGTCPHEKYRSLKSFCVGQGVVGCLFSLALGWLCLRGLW